MSKKFSDEEITLDYAKNIYDAAVNYFCNGVYVPTIGFDAHPCGWDFISFESIENNTEDRIYAYHFDDYEISNGYGSTEYMDKTLLEILKMTHGQIAFEKNQIDWL